MNFDELMYQVNRRAEARRASDREMARLNGMTIEEFDADTTAPDPPGDQFDYQCLHCDYGSDDLMDVVRHLSTHGIGACRIGDHIRCNIAVLAPTRIPQPPPGWNPFGGAAR